MVFKINISHKGKTYKVETENEGIIGNLIGQKISGEEFSADLTGYELEITGTSDKAGFPGFVEHQGPALKKVLLKYGKGMWKMPKGLRKKTTIRRPKGLRLRKTVRGKEISADTVQINTKVVKEGSKKFVDLLPKKEATTETPSQ